MSPPPPKWVLKHERAKLTSYGLRGWGAGNMHVRSRVSQAPHHALLARDFFTCHMHSTPFSLRAKSEGPIIHIYQNYPVAFL